MNNNKLYLAWEATQDPLTTYANISAYTLPGGIQSFCSFYENTYLIRIQKNNIRAYYDQAQSEKAAQNGLNDFLDSNWVTEFTLRSDAALADTRLFLEKYHNKQVGDGDIIDAVRTGIELLNRLFTVFQACQPQYTSLVEEHLRTILGDSLPNIEKTKLLAHLSKPATPSFLQREARDWKDLLQQLHKHYDAVPRLTEVGERLKAHLANYKFIGAADGLNPWDENCLYKRLADEWTSYEAEGDASVRPVVNQHVPAEVLTACNTIGLLGNYRLSLRVEGWMPLTYVLTKELVPQLSSVVDYKDTEILHMTHPELLAALRGSQGPDKTELAQRMTDLVFGILDGQTVCKQGSEVGPFLSRLICDEAAKDGKVTGTPATPGVVQAPCHIINWHQSLEEQIDSMPEGAIMIAGQTRPQLMVAIKKASGIITDEGGVLSHAAIVSRELSIPCIIGTGNATKMFRTGDTIKLDAEKGIAYLVPSS